MNMSWKWYGATLLYAVLWSATTQGGCSSCPPGGGGYTLPLECTVYPPCNDSIAQIFYACSTEIENLGIHPQLSQNYSYFLITICNCGKVPVQNAVSNVNLQLQSSSKTETAPRHRLPRFLFPRPQTPSSLRYLRNASI